MSAGTELPDYGDVEDEEDDDDFEFGVYGLSQLSSVLLVLHSNLSESCHLSLTFNFHHSSHEWFSFSES